MKLFLSFIIVGLIALPAFAQDIDLGFGGDVSGLLNIPAPRGNTPARGNANARGNAPARGAAPNGAPVDRLVRLRELLAQSNLPLSQEQETALTALVSAEIPIMRQALQKRVQELQKAKAPASPPSSDTQRGTTAPAAANLPSMEELTPEIVRLNDELLGKIADASALTEDQRRLLKKLYKDQVKSRGGFDAIKLTMQDAGSPFSAEQIEQIQPLFDQQNEARLQLVKEAQGQAPDKAKLDQLQRETLAKVLRLLTAPQRAALLAK
jgi:hypothetical protein